MEKNLYNEPLHFVRWFFILFPKRIFDVALRIIQLLNHKLSFTLNLKLIFTPFFNDYTKVGRIIGFFVRTFQIVFGFILLILASIILLLTPLFWFYIPLIIFDYSKFGVLVYLVVIFIYEIVITKNVPLKRVVQVDENNPVEAYRPKTRKLFEELKRAGEFTNEFLGDKSVLALLKKLELAHEKFITKLLSSKVDFSNLAKFSYQYAKTNEARYIETEHLFLAALATIPKADLMLTAFSTSLTNCEMGMSWIVSNREKKAKVLFWQEDYKVPKMGGIGKGMTGHITPFLNSVSEDFTKKAQSGEFENIVAHKDLINKVINLLSSANTNVLLIGPPGCGKTSVVKGIAREVMCGTSKKSIQFKRIVGLDASSLLAGTKTSGDISEKIKKIMDEAKSSKDIILFFDEIHSLISGASGQDESMIFSLLEPHLASTDIQFIGATNIENYRKFIEPSGSFANIFEIVEIPPASDSDTLLILEAMSHDLEKKYGVVITYLALDEIIKLSNKLIHERVFPDKALDILNRTVSAVSQNTKYVTAAEVRKVISEITHVPVTNLSEDDSEKLLGLEDELKKSIIGQDLALNKISKALQRARMGIRDENRPIASFLFVGTTGVGKTETAKVLAKNYFNDKKSLIRIDMSEYQQQDSLNRLIGDPNGATKGILTEAVRSRPYALILLDEIEKAYSSILLTFLQVLDDGRLTDSSGFTVDFSNTIIIATSNVGTYEIQKVIGRGGTDDEVSKVALDEVRQHYAPELLNRFDDIIVYKPLKTETVKKIARLMLQRVAKIADEKGIKVSFSEDLITELAKKGFDNRWGARELNRLIKDTVETYLAQQMLKKELNQGDVIELDSKVLY